MKIVKNDLFDYPNRYIFQIENGFKFSLDSILLAEFVRIPKGKFEMLDMCMGNAPIPLIISTKTTQKIYGFEIQKDIYELAKKSIEYNNLSEQIMAVNEDILNISKIFPGKYYDIIVCNPPYFPGNNLKEVNKNDYLTIARHEVSINLENIFKIASRYLKDKGNFYLVHRPSRLDEIIMLANKYEVPVKEIQIITTKANLPRILLIRMQKKAKIGLKFRKIIDVSKLDSYQHIFEEENL